MLRSLFTANKWSDLGLRFLKLSIIMTVLLSVLDGVLHVQSGSEISTNGLLHMSVYWVADFRYVFENGILASVLLFVGAKVFETRTVLSVGFDAIDASKMSLTGPDENNVVWIGRRYASPSEAQMVADALKGQLDASAPDAASPASQ